MGGQRNTPAALLPENETRYPLYKRLGGTEGRLVRVRKTSPSFQPPRTEIRSPDRPSDNESLYRLRCPGAYCRGMAVRDVVNPKNVSFALPAIFYDIIWYSQELDER